MHSGGVQLFGQRSQPAQSDFFGARASLACRLGCTFAKALFCRRRRRASGAFEGLPALKPVFDHPYACTVRQLGPQGRKERKRAGNLFRKWLRLRGHSIPRGRTGAPHFFPLRPHPRPHPCPRRCHAARGIGGELPPQSDPRGRPPPRRARRPRRRLRSPIFIPRRAPASSPPSAALQRTAARARRRGGED